MTSGRAGLWVSPALVVILVAAQIVLVLGHPQLPTSDGPPHKYSAWVYRELTEDPSSPLAHYFEKRDSWLYPNAAYSFYLVHAQRWLTLDQAEQWGSVLYLVCLVAAFHYLLRSFGQSPWLALVLLQTLSLNYLFFMGFFNYVWGVPMALVGLGVAHRHIEEPSWRHVVVGNLVLLIAFWCHLVAFALAVLCSGVLTALNGYRGFISRTAAWLPASLVALAFWPKSAEVLSNWKYPDRFLDRIWRIISYRVSTAFGGAEIFVAAAVGIAILIGACVVIWRFRSRPPVRSLALLSLVLLVLGSSVPRGAGAGFFIDDRVSLFFWLITIAVVGAYSGRGNRILVPLAAGLALVHFGFVESVTRDFNSENKTFVLGVEHIPKGTPTFVYPELEESRPGIVQPWISAQSRYSLALQAPDLHHFHADPRHSGHFPIRYTTESLAYYPGERPVGRIRPVTVSRFAPYVVFWGERPLFEKIFRQQLGFRSVFESRPLLVLEQPRRALAARLERLRRHPSSEGADRFFRWIRTTEGLGLARFLSSHVAVANLYPDGWTRGTSPAAVMVHNEADETMTVGARVRRHSDSRVPSITLYVTDGEDVREVEFGSSRSLRVPLGKVPPKADRLFLLWTDSCRLMGESGKRCLGARFVDIMTDDRSWALSGGRSIAWSEAANGPT